MQLAAFSNRAQVPQRYALTIHDRASRIPESTRLNVYRWHSPEMQLTEEDRIRVR
jgi:hypothetical protein